MGYTPSVKDIIFIFFKRKRLILSITLLIVFIVAADNIIRYPIYKASSRVLIKPGTADIVVTPGDTKQVVVPKISVEDINSEIAIIKSRPLMDGVVKFLQLDKIEPTGYRLLKKYLPFQNSWKDSDKAKFAETVNTLHDDVWVEVVDKSNIIQINYSSSNPELTAGVINTLIDLFLEQHLKVHQTPKAHDFFQSEVGKYKVLLESAEKALKEFQEDEDMVSFEEQKRLNINALFEFEGLLKEVDIEIAGLKEKIEVIKAQLTEGPEGITEKAGDNSVPGTYSFFQSEAGKYKVLLESAEKALKEFQEDEDMASFEEQKRLNINALFEFEGLLKEVDIEIAGLKEKIEVIKAQLSKEPERVLGAKRVEDNPVVRELRVKLLDLKLELNNLLQKFSKDNRNIKEKMEEIKMVREMIEIEEKRVVESETSDLNLIYQSFRKELLEGERLLKELLPKREAIGKEITFYREQIRELNRKELRLRVLEREVEISKGRFLLYSDLTPVHQSLREEFLNGEGALKEFLSKREAIVRDVDFYKERIRELNRKELRLRVLEREVETNRDKFLLYSEKEEEARVSKALAQEKIVNVSIVSRAFIPVEPVGPNTILNTILAFILGLFVSSIFALILESLDHSFKTPADIEKELGLPHLASIPDKS